MKIGKNILTFALILLTTIVSFGQAPNWDWAKRAGRSSNDQGLSITSDASGNSYVVGFFYSPSITFDTTTLINNAITPSISCDIFITKYDINGNILWAKKAGGAADDYAFSGTTDASGNIYITGYCVGSITFDTITLSGGGFRDMFIAKYDTNGNILWARRAGGSGDDEGQSVSVDASGKIYLTGFFGSSSITFGSTTLTNTTSGSSDQFLVKYDTNGTTLWARKSGGTNYDYPTSVCADVFNGIYLVGYFYSPTITFGTTVLTNSAGVNMYIVKYDNSGNLLWAKNPGLGHFNCVTTNNLGEVFAAGDIANSPVIFGSDTLTNVGNADMFVVKYDTAGNPVWAKSGGGTASDVAKSLTVDALSNVYVAGFFQSPFISFPTDTLIKSSPITDFFIVSYDNNGNVLWSKSDEGYSINVDAHSICSSAGNVYVTGTFYNDTIAFDSFLLVNDTTDGSQDMFVGKFTASILTELSEQKVINSNSFIVFPNPTFGIINISSNDSFEKIIITDVLGQIIFQEKSFNKDISFHLEKTGIYFITLVYEKQTTTRKLIVQH